MKKSFALIALCAMFTLSGCNTTKGFGQDLQKVGDKVETSSENCQSGKTC